MNTPLPAVDYEHIIHFASDIAEPAKNIRATILQQLASRFGYEKSIFWVADDDGNLTDPVVYGLSDQVIHHYMEKFSKHDFLHPKKNLTLFRSRKMLRLIDIVVPDEYEESLYYQGFMAPHGTYDEMVVLLMHREKIVGAIGLGGEGKFEFSKQDCKRFLLMSKLIGTTFMHQHQADHTLLSERENDVVALVKEGMTNRKIAEKLFISHNTVKKHLQNIYRKYKVNNKIQLIQKL